MQAVCECLCVDLESSGLEPSRFSKCSSCKFGAECDEDSEGIWLVNMCFVFVYYRAEAPNIMSVDSLDVKYLFYFRCLHEVPPFLKFIF